MRQPTNLRGATLPGLSQPSEKEGPHHRSLCLPKLQRQADSPSFTLLSFLRPLLSPSPVAERPSLSTAPLFWWLGNPFAFQRRSADTPAARCLIRSALFFILCVQLPGRLCWYSHFSGSVWEPVATEPEAWHLNCPGNMAARCGVGNINHRKLGGRPEQTRTWQEVRELGVKFHRLSITSCHPVLRCAAEIERGDKLKNVGQAL